MYLQVPPLSFSIFSLRTKGKGRYLKSSPMMEIRNHIDFLQIPPFSFMEFHRISADTSLFHSETGVCSRYLHFPFVKIQSAEVSTRYPLFFRYISHYMVKEKRVLLFEFNFLSINMIYETGKNNLISLSY